MSIFGDDGFGDLLNDGDELPDVADYNEQIFNDSEQADPEPQQESVGPVKVQPKKRNVLNPRPRLNAEVLKGQRGLHTIEEYYKDIKFKGKGKENEDLDEVLRRLQHWGHRMYPNYKFDDLLTNIERLAKKKPLQVHMSRYRLGMLESMKNHGEIINEDDDEDQPVAAVDVPYDEFDALLDEQIAISRIDPRTPGSIIQNNVHSNTSIPSSSFATPSFSKGILIISTPYTQHIDLNNTDDLATPLPPSQPSTPAPNQQLNAQQLARIEENKRIAKERLAAKKRVQQEGEICSNTIS